MVGAAVFLLQRDSTGGFQSCFGPIGLPGNANVALAPLVSRAYAMGAMLPI